MDLNELLYRHRVSLACAAIANSVEARLCRQQLAAGYAQWIDDAVGEQRASDIPLVPLG